ncbi:23S rRNA (guanosine(2251)-2'-O)-methyltransferase RlmB [uncultured Clostridium sp.]|uniref:23S rRNA (guanosine(2251)-2'-O)-methyltransferase RlmB n=1 Tax=uncultured Clostridium sp. TaxID=59620 RepID=UPI00262E12B3|nr:23S rRNA (guanosine(2251)-2'-O)-methyltransferase RlmB [uncultured Clostridium sp.]
MTKSENRSRQMRQYQKDLEKVQRRERYEEKAAAAALVEGKIEGREDLVEGRNAVIELLKSGRTTVEQIFIAKGKMEGSITKVIGLAKDLKVVLKEVDRKKLDSMSETGAHQGVIAQITPFVYSEVDEILAFAESKGEAPFIIILDELEDPHNLGSLVRTGELCGVHGIIIPKRRNVGVTGTVYKTAAGAIEHMKIAKVTNVNNEIDKLKAKGVWVYGSDIRGGDYSYNTDFSGPCALIIGNEGKGMSKLTAKKCDKLVKIPMVGKINSLNASVAGGIIMYEILKSRLIK